MPAVRQHRPVFAFFFLSTFIARHNVLLLLLLLQLSVPLSVSRVPPSVFNKSAWAQRHAGSFDSGPFAERAEGLHVTLKPQL